MSNIILCAVVEINDLLLLLLLLVIFYQKLGGATSSHRYGMDLYIRAKMKNSEKIIIPYRFEQFQLLTFGTINSTISPL
jgi:hypothetical protein